MVEDLSFLKSELSDAQALGRRLFQQSYHKGKLARFWSKLTRRPHQLLNWDDAAADDSPSEHKKVTRQSVLIRAIRGSFGRSSDFDVDFHPVNQDIEERWVNISVARLKGTPLPPVKLIQARDVYYVQDGHHRISVAQALGQKEIDATVTSLDAEQPAAAVQKRMYQPQLVQG